jgi:hypothetical protein
MPPLTVVLIAIALAFLVAGLTALLKLGSGEILRIVEARWKARGVITLIICWFVLLPIMMLVSILFGLYRFLTVKPHYV